MQPIQSCGDLNQAIYDLTSLMITTSKECLLKPERRGRKSNKGSDIWNPTISRLVKANKEGHFEWKEVGQPSDHHHPASLLTKTAKRNLRTAIRRTTREINENCLVRLQMPTIMTLNFSISSSKHNVLRLPILPIFLSSMEIS